ncbi:hypothetical protein ROHU_011104 [Labeo rohita]|uniref:Carboxymuconolactone decarboxylase-like domain-containing protein n=1 Tax=Labeo rohita TaxID=84645 RepID=A0A498LNT9_LABRO|nr:hypothetical protein ROHU_011104 [Labeo rohita]
MKELVMSHLHLDPETRSMETHTDLRFCATRMPLKEESDVEKRNGEGERSTVLTCPSKQSLSENSNYSHKAQQQQFRDHQQGGFLPNVFKVLAHRPAEFRAFFSYYNALMNKESGGLSKADRELIVVATSAHNHCLYCVVSHSALHRIYSKKTMLADQVAVNYKVAELSAREKAMLDFALTVCRSETVTEEHFSTLEAHGFDREDIWDIAAIAAFFALSNRMAHLTDMRPNAEFYNMGRVPRDKAKASDGQVKYE